MGWQDIAALPVGDLVTREGGHLFLCATGPCLPQALRCIDAWGFKYSGMGFVWIKTKRDVTALDEDDLVDDELHVGLGMTTRKNAEYVLLARRGNVKRRARDVREVILAPRREHSRKPDEIRARIERYCAGPYAEVFSREDRPGWDCYGDEAGKFNGRP